MYKILSLDGGGSWAILQLLTLKERYKDEIPELNGHAILKQFDMVIANSGGSIVLCALAEDWTIDKALTLFDDKSIRESIFSENSFWETFWPVSITKMFSFGPKYSSSRKYEAFRKLFPKAHKMTMDDLPDFIGKPSLKLIVCTFDALNNRAKFFRSYTPNNATEEFVPLTKAIHGSSNAPVQYFDFPARIKADKTNIWYYLWDGALGGFNNPVVAGIIEAFRLSIPLDDITVISLGNANKLMSKAQKDRFYQVRSITIKERKKKLLFWRYKFQFEFFKETVMNQAKTILFQPPDWANYVGLMFLSKSISDDIENRFIRLSPIIHIDKNTNPLVIELLDKLYSMDMDLTKDEEIDLLKECFLKWRDGKIKNQPIEFSVTRENELMYSKGDEYFSEGLKKWKRI
ncbi:patatin-like phospholipase family protein [uncultured Dokdonia sp.]|uniref:patatin-like phospholipase family protein n=1 Tax=uncultured Dokdonia sp. TaxID=575653 RepID=UPI00262A1E1A|nr:patatin-like phospholipase family protein [uncultured Dokdonia sp.]